MLLPFLPDAACLTCFEIVPVMCVKQLTVDLAAAHFRYAAEMLGLSGHPCSMQRHNFENLLGRREASVDESTTESQ